MLILRSLRLPQLRSLANSASVVKHLTTDDVDFIWNPDDAYLDAFMECHGNERGVFKKSDILMWRNCFGDAYKFRVLCLKGTKKVISCGHSCDIVPLDSSANKAGVFIGMGWADEAFRKARVAPLMGDMVTRNVSDASTYFLSNVNGYLHRFWTHVCCTPDDGVSGHGSMDVGFKSFYPSKDVFIPPNLSFEDITVKSAHDVPKKDIINYDHLIHPYHRERYIICHMRDVDGFGKVAYDEKGNVIGMAQAVIYPAGDCNLGPFYGDSPRVVQALFAEILKDIAASGKQITHFEVRSNQMCKDSFTWIKPFLKCQLSREYACNLLFKITPPKNIDFSKVYCPTHAQLFVV